MTAPRILVVEDDTALLEMLQTNLEQEGFACDVAKDGVEGLAKALQREYALVILDRALPRLNGLDVLKKLRAESTQLPVIFLTSKGEATDKIVGLELGADDYVTKPFVFGELLARIRAILRRAQHEPSGESLPRISVGPLVIDTRTRKVQLNGEAVQLTALEYDLLLYLASTPDVPRTREQILRAVWQTEFYGYEESVNVAVRRLRAKIEEKPADPQMIQTVRGVGYVFVSGRN